LQEPGLICINLRKYGPVRQKPNVFFVFPRVTSTPPAEVFY